MHNLCTTKEKAVIVGAVTVNLKSVECFVMESYYCAREIADMHFMYGRANGNPQEARRLYTEHYSQRRIPYHKLFTEFQQRLSESGSSAPRASDCGRS
jgi:hypothetical protein